MFVSPKAFHGMMLMLSFAATPSSSISSSWEKKGQEEEDIYAKYIRRTSSRAASTKDAEGFGGGLDDIQAIPRELKAGKKKKKNLRVFLPPPVIPPPPVILPPPVLPFAHCDRPVAAAVERTSCDMPPVFSEGTDLGDFCVGCPQMSMTVDNFLAIAPVLAGANPFCSTFAYASTAPAGPTPGLSLGNPFLEDAACLVNYVQGVSQIQDDSFIYKVDEEYRNAVVDFCVHKCGEDFWGLLKEIQMAGSSTENFINAKCSMTSQSATACDSANADACTEMEHNVIGDNSCDGVSACKKMKFSTVGENSCIAKPGELEACQKLEASTIGSQSCIGEWACTEARRLTISNGACVGPSACISAISANIGNGACVGSRVCNSVTAKNIGEGACFGSGACISAASKNIGMGACNGTDACNSVTSAYIGTNSCIGEDACNSASSVNIGNGACLGYAACIVGKVDVGNNACTCEGCCKCDAVNGNAYYIANGIPNGKCKALGEVGCCPVPTS
jgi:serine acetyltransferase